MTLRTLLRIIATSGVAENSLMLDQHILIEIDGKKRELVSVSYDGVTPLRLQASEDMSAEIAAMGHSGGVFFGHDDEEGA